MRRALDSRFVPARGCRDPRRPWRKSATQRILHDLTSKLFHGQGNKPPPSFVYMTKRATCDVRRLRAPDVDREFVSGRGERICQYHTVPYGQPHRASQTRRFQTRQGAAGSNVLRARQRCLHGPSANPTFATNHQHAFGHALGIKASSLRACFTPRSQDITR